MKRIACTALFLLVAASAQASEITNFPIEPSLRARAEVQAEARVQPRKQPGELYDGRQAAQVPAALPKSREQVRMEARAGMLDATQRNDRVGGM